MAGGWLPKRKRPGGFVGFLLDGNPLGRGIVFRAARKQVFERTGGHYPAPFAALEAVEHGLKHGLAERSEERRVGKECRSRWERSHEEKKGARREEMCASSTT